MPIKVTCPECETVNKVADEKAGKKIRCSECEASISVPADGKKGAASKTKEAPKKGGSGLLLILLGGGFVLLLCCGGGSVGGYFLFFTGDTSKMITKKDDAKIVDKGNVIVKKKAEPKPPVEIKTSVPGESAGLAITPDAKLAIIMGLGGTKNNVEIWDLQNKAKLQTFSGARHARGLAISPDGKFAAFSDGRGMATRVETGSDKQTELQINPIPLAPLNAFLRFSSTSDTLYYAADRKVHSWDLKGKHRVVLQNTGQPECLSAFFDGGKRIAMGDSSGGIQIFEVGNPAAVKSFKHKGLNPVNCMVTADGKTLLSVTRLGRDLIVWDIAVGSQQPVKLAEATPLKSPPVLTPDGKTLIYPTNKHNIVLVNVANGQPDFELKGHTQEITALDLSADGATLVSLGRDNTLNIWDIRDLK